MISNASRICNKIDSAFPSSKHPKIKIQKDLLIMLLFIMVVSVSIKSYFVDIFYEPNTFQIPKEIIWSFIVIVLMRIYPMLQVSRTEMIAMQQRFDFSRREYIFVKYMKVTLKSLGIFLVSQIILSLATKEQVDLNSSVETIIFVTFFTLSLLSFFELVNVYKLTSLKIPDTIKTLIVILGICMQLFIMGYLVLGFFNTDIITNQTNFEIFIPIEIYPMLILQIVGIYILTKIFEKGRW